MNRSTPDQKTSQPVIIEGQQIIAESPEGRVVRMPLGKFVELLNASTGRSGTDCVLADGIKFTATRGPVTIWVYERPPQIYSLKWITRDSPKPFGRGTAYRTVRIALPYLLVLAVFMRGRHNKLQLSGYNECFFRTAPLRSIDDELCFPALLNCSKFNPPAGRPLSWICSAKMDFEHLAQEAADDRRMRASLVALLHTLLETGYNRSSEHHEESSWFTESTRVDARIAAVENWEQATEQDPLFVLDVPWLETGLTLGGVVDRIFENLNVSQPEVSSAVDIRRILFNAVDSATAGSPLQHTDG